MKSREETAGSMQGLHPEAVPPGELVAAAARATTPGFLDDQVRLVTDVDPEAPRVLVDRERLRQVIVSLLKNARAHSSPGGAVIVTAKAWQGRVRIAIADAGDGIPSVHRERIFEPFYQVPGTQDRGDVGLGLAIAKSIVHSHGGEIHCESEEGRGATFWFTLPMAVSNH